MAKKILVIDDEPELVKALTIRLESKGYEVAPAYDGEEGLSKIRATKPELVLLDIMLPKLDGRDMLKKAKEDPDIKDIPIVILSAKAEQWDRELALKLGAEEYIEKPLEALKLLRQISNVFKRQKNPS